MGNFLKNLPPNQRRIAIAGAIGGLVGLLVLWRRNQGGGGSATAASPDAGTPSAAMTADTPAGGSTFADNGEGLATLNTTMTGIDGKLDDLLSGNTGGSATGGAEDTGGATPTAPAPTVIVNVPPAASAPAQLSKVGGGNVAKQTGGAITSPAKPPATATNGWTPTGQTEKAPPGYPNKGPHGWFRRERDAKGPYHLYQSGLKVRV